MQLRPKILAHISLLTFVVVVAMSGTYYYLFTQNVRVRSQQRVDLAFEFVLDDLRTRVETTLPQIEQFVNTSLLTPLYLLDVLAQQENAPEQELTVWRLMEQLTYISEIAFDTERFGELSDASHILVYDARQQLVAASWQDEERIAGVYLSELEQGVFAPVDKEDLWYATLRSFEEIPRQPLPGYIPPVYPGELPQDTTVTMHHVQDRVTLRFLMPVRDKEGFKGICMVFLPIRQEDVERYARLSGTAVNLFAGAALSVGTLPDYAGLPEERLSQAQRIDWQARSPLPSIHFNEQTVQGQSYYQGVLPLRGDDGPVGAISVHYPRMLEAQEKRNFLMAAAVVTLLFGGVVMAEAVGLSGMIVKPVSRLMTVMEEMQGGNLDVEAPVDTSDEMGRLAATFNSMTARLKASFVKIEVQARCLEQQNSELKRLDKMKDEFLSNTSHELRTPLNGITGLADAILNGVDGPLTGQERKHIRMIQQSSKRLTNLVNSLLDFSKMRSHTLELHRNPIPIAEVADVVCIFLQTQLQDKPVTLRTDLPPDLPEVYADIDKVEQILTILRGTQ